MKPVGTIQLDKREIDFSEGEVKYRKNILLTKSIGANTQEYGMSPIVGNDTSNIGSTLRYIYTIIGVIELDDDNYAFCTTNGSGNSCIYLYWGSTLYLIVDDTSFVSAQKLGFSLSFPIKGVYRKNFNNEYIISFTDNNTVPFLLNLGNPELFSTTTPPVAPKLYYVNNTNGYYVASAGLYNLTWEINNAYLFPKLNNIDQTINPTTITTDVIDGGALLSGAAQVAIGYVGNDLSETNYFFISTPMGITDDPFSGDYQIYDGCVAGTQTNKAIQVTINNPDTRYTNIVVALISKINGIITQVKLPYFSVSGNPTTFVISGNEVTSAITLDEIIVNTTVYTKVKAMTVYNDELDLGNLETVNQSNLQSIINGVTLNWVCKLLTVGDYGNGAGENAYTNTTLASTANETKSDTYTQFKAFKCGETYAFYIRGVDAYGLTTDWFHVPGRTSSSGEKDLIAIDGADQATEVYKIRDTAYAITIDIPNKTSTGTFGFWENEDEEYPVSFGLGTGVKVRHHTFPSIVLALSSIASTRFNPTECAINTDCPHLGVTVTNYASILTAIQAVSPNIVSLQLGYAQRSYANARVVGNSAIFTYGVQAGVYFSTAGNWDIDGNGVANIGFDVTNKYIRFHDYNLLRTKPVLSNLYIRNNYLLRKVQVTGGTDEYEDVLPVGAALGGSGFNIYNNQAQFNGANTGVDVRVYGIVDYTRGDNDYANGYYDFAANDGTKTLTDWTNYVVLTSGLLTSGKTYVISDFNTGDDFSTSFSSIISGAINTTGCIFVANATPPINWSNLSRLTNCDTELTAYKAVSGLQYIPNNIQVGSFQNVKGEQHIVLENKGTPFGDYASIVVPATFNNLEPRDPYHTYDTSPPTDGFNAAPTSAIINADLCQIKDNMYLGFYSQDVVACTQNTSITQTSGLLIVGRQYQITSNTTGIFTGVGAANNNVGTIFTASGTVPTWGDAVLTLPSCFYGGDIFVTDYSLCLEAPVGSDDFAPNGTAGWGFKVIHRFNVECVDNIHLRHVDTTIAESAYYPKSAPVIAGGNRANLQTMLALFNPYEDTAIQIYNTDYNALNNVYASSVYNPYLLRTNKFPYRVARSLVQQKESLQNNWRKFLAADYYTSVSNYGEIVSLAVMGDKLIIQHRDTFFITRGAVQQKQGLTSVTIGTGDLFDPRPIEILTSQGGYIGCKNIFGAKVIEGIYYVIDLDKNKIFAYTGESLPYEINDLGITDFLRTSQIQNINQAPFNTTANTTDSVSIAYDQQYGRILFNFSNATNSKYFTFSYYPDYLGTKVIGSFHTYKNGYLFNTRTKVWNIANRFNSATYNQVAYQLNANNKCAYYIADGSGARSQTVDSCFVDVVFNTVKVETQRGFARTGADITKILGNVSWISEVIALDSDGKEVSNFMETITELNVRTKYANSGEVTLINNVNLTIADNKNNYNAEETWNLNKVRDLILDRNKANVESIYLDFNNITSNIATNYAFFQKRFMISKFFIIRFKVNSTFNSTNKELYLYDVEIEADKSFR